MSQSGRRKGAQLDGIAAFLFDVDGTLMHGAAPAEGGHALPGAAELLRHLRRAGIPFCCFTNGSSQTPAAYARGFRALGLEVEDTEVMTPAVVAARYISRRWQGSRVLALGGKGLIEPLHERGIEVVGEVSEWRRAQIVLVGWDTALNMERLEAACRAVWEGAAFLVTSSAPAFQLRDGRGVGLSAAIAAAISKVTGRRPEVMGKPSAHAVAEAARLLRVPAQHMAVVGDDIDIEVRMGRRHGAITVLVMTGTSAAVDVNALPARLRPDVVLPDVGHLLGLIESQVAT